MALNSKQQLAADLYANGCDTSAIKQATGYTDSYISQLKVNSEWQEAVQQLRHKEASRSHKLDKAYKDLEYAAVCTLKARAPVAEVNELTRILDTLYKRRQGGVTAPTGTNTGQGAVVQVTLPKHMMDKIGIDLSLRVNPQNEVIEIGGLATAPLTEEAFLTKKDEHL